MALDEAVRCQPSFFNTEFRLVRHSQLRCYVHSIVCHTCVGLRFDMPLIKRILIDWLIDSAHHCCPTEDCACAVFKIYIFASPVVLPGRTVGYFPRCFLASYSLQWLYRESYACITQKMRGKKCWVFAFSASFLWRVLTVFAIISH